MENIIYLIKNILSPLFYKITTISICASIVGIILLITKKILKNKISSKINQIIWIIFFVSLLFIPKIENKFSIYNFINIEKIKELSININFNSLETYENLNSIESHQFDDFQRNVTKQIDKLEIKEIISIMYFTVIVFKIIKIIIIVLIYYKTDKQILTYNSEEYILLEKIKKKLKINKNIILIKTKYINSPMIGGLFSPKIFISDEKINEKDLECMLTHELCHFKRKDNITNIFINFFKSIHFFNPIIIMCLNRIEKDIELATDELTLQILDKNNINRYCTLLVLMSNRQNIIKFNLGFAKTRNFIEERINTIIYKNKFIENKKYIIILIFIIIAIIFFCFTKEKIYINNDDLKYLTININSIDYEIENYELEKEYKYIKCNINETIKLYGNESLFSLSLNTKKLETNKENNSTFFFNNNDIEINIGNDKGKFLYEFKIQYETKQEIKYGIIIEIE